MYYFQCLCGRDIASASRECVCPQCQRQIVLEWGADPLVVQDMRTEEKETEV